MTRDLLYSDSPGNLICRFVFGHEIRRGLKYYFWSHVSLNSSLATISIKSIPLTHHNIQQYWIDEIEVRCGMKIRISSWLENRFKIVGRCKIDIYGWTGSSVAMPGWQPVMSDNTNLISSTTDNSCVGSIMLLKSSMINIPNSDQSDLSVPCLIFEFNHNCHFQDSSTL